MTTCLRDTAPARMLFSAVATIGENIKAARLEAGIATQRALAAKLGVPQPQMSDWENDRYVPDLKTLKRIADGIPCSTDRLLLGVNLDADVGAEAAHEKNSDVVTYPITTLGVEQGHPTSGGEIDVQSATRESESEGQQFFNRVAQREESIAKLELAYAAIGDVLRALRLGAAAPHPGGAEPAAASVHSGRARRRSGRVRR